MIAFRLLVNGRRIATAGLTGHHVLSSILTSAWRDPRRWTSEKRFLEREIRLALSGLDIDLQQHVHWVSRAIQVGDRIEIEVLDAADVDEPMERKKRTRSRVTKSGTAAPSSKGRVKRTSAPSRERRTSSKPSQRPRKKAR